MKDFESLSSPIRRMGDRPLSDQDFNVLQREIATRNEAISKSIEAITILMTRIITVDACIDLLSNRAPFSSLDRAMDTMKRLCAELSAQCMEIYEFCVTDNVISIQYDGKSLAPQDDNVDMAADKEAPYGKNANII